MNALVGLLVAPVLGVVLFEIEPERGADPWIWVVGGDVPSAYMEFDDEITPTAVGALDVYVGLISDWADAVTAGASLDEVFPVDAEPTMANVELPRGRLSFIRNRVIPNYGRSEDQPDLPD